MKPVHDAPPPSEIAPWRDLTEERATAVVMSGGSLLILGAPGTGQTFFARQLILALREQGRRVDVISKTHAATQYVGVAGAETADHWVRSKIRTGGQVPCQVLFVEELTMMDAQLWPDTCKLHLSGQVACVLSGDFEQFPAVLETWAGSALPAGKLEQSHMVRELAGSNRLTLQKNPQSDEVLFDFYTSIFSSGFTPSPKRCRRRASSSQ